MDFDADDTKTTAQFYKLNSTEFDAISNCEYGPGIDFKQIFVEVIHSICYISCISTSEFCFTKSIEFLTGKDHGKSSLHFIRDGKKMKQCND